MGYKPYADADFYREVYKGTIIPEDEIERRLYKASRHIDALTYNRIVSRGISGLTEFQADIIREVCCEQADFEYENHDLIETVLSGYSLNGASVQFENSWNVMTDKGIAMKRETYSMLKQTGLCSRLAVVR